MKKALILFVLVVCIGMQSCESEQHKMGFYHWKTGFAPVLNEKLFLEKAQDEKVYVRAFDLVWNASTQQEEDVSFMKIKPDSLNYVNEVALVVFIDNFVLRNIQKNQLLFMAARTAQLLKISRGQFVRNSDLEVLELQIDCDWTLRTKEKYFIFLEHMRQEAARIGFTKLTATIRLHQIKFKEKTGVPPVDEGVLMFYNMGDFEDPLERNSILNIELGAEYLDKLDEYPMHLDVALPLFSWGIQKRNKRAIDIISNLTAAQVEAAKCCTPLANNTYRVDSARYLNNQYVYPGDELKIEQVELSQVKKAAAMLSEKMPNQDYRVILYHLDYKLMEDLTFEDIEEIARE